MDQSAAPAQLNAEVPDELSDLVMKLLGKGLSQTDRQRPGGGGGVARSGTRAASDPGDAAASAKTGLTQRNPWPTPSRKHPTEPRALATGPSAPGTRAAGPFCWRWPAAWSPPSPWASSFLADSGRRHPIESDDPAVEVVFDKDGPRSTAPT